ncbi:MAG: CDP-alcohol phosphatidyltransferase family protein [Myxococcota bacterium]
MVAPSIKARVARWRYVVPNAITCASLTIGLVASARAFVVGDFVDSAWLVVLCVLLDKLDGTAARALKATSAIGVQLDSFADFVTFGVAPGALLFAAGLKARGSGVGWWAGDGGQLALSALCAAYVVAACLRLAKFNVLASVPAPPGVEQPKVFYGLPSTFAGGLLATTYIIADKYQVAGLLQAMPILALLLGLLMLSNLPMPKLVARKSKAFNVFQVVNIVVVYALSLLRVLPEYLISNVAIYLVVGFGWGFMHRKELLAARRLDPYEAPDPPDED